MLLIYIDSVASFAFIKTCIMINTISVIPYYTKPINTKFNINPFQGKQHHSFANHKLCYHHYGFASFGF